MKLDPLSRHVQVDRYGEFWLTEAIRPSLDLQVVPRQGYRLGTYRDRQAGLRVPVVAAAVSRERLFDVFLDMLDPLGEVVDVVLETSHDDPHGRHRDLRRHAIDLPVLKSHLCDFEELLLHDGCTGVAVIARHLPMELQFDEHKLLIVYARDLTPFVDILEAAGVARDDDLRLISEGEHLHSTEAHHRLLFEELANRLGVGDAAEPVRW
ncbi:MAG: hypothetical protein NZ700_13640 [Gemmataceae bacterium]|nr:hypothetical protein [Gemmataceae bacterium]MDW8266573.1 hypothetical protein [Gemmataceae bacterium]